MTHRRLPLPLRRPSRRLRLLALLPLAAALVVPVNAAAAHADPAVAVLRAAPDGSATSDCTPQDPCTLPRAQQQARRLAAGGADRDIRVVLAGGTYRLTAPLAFTAADSAPAGHTVTWTAAPGARPVLSGGRTVTGWTLRDPAKNIWSAPAGDLTTRQLYVDGRRAVLARTAFAHPTSFCSPSACKWTAEGLQGPGIAKLAALGDTSRLELVRHVRWKDYHCPVASIEGDLARMAQPCWTNAAKTPRIHPDWNGATWQAYGGGVTYAQNAYGLLTEPGQFYLDTAAHTVSYIPRKGEDLTRAEVVAPVAEQLVTVTGTPDDRIRGLAFQNLTFADTTFLRPGTDEGYAATQAGFTLTGATGPAPDNAGRYGTLPTGAVEVTAGEGITFRGDTFTRLGDAGLTVQQSRGTLVTRNRFHDLSGGGLYMGPTWAAPPEAEQSRDNTVSFNTVDRTGAELMDSVGLWFGNEINTVIDHNSIDHTPYSGMSVGWGWTSTDRQNVAANIRITGNRITNTLRAETQMFDGGALYTTNNLNGSEISGNYVDRNDNGNAYYLDAGTDNVTVHDNVGTRLGFKWISANLASLHTGLTAYRNWSDTAFCSFGGDNGTPCTAAGGNSLHDNATGLTVLPPEAIAVARAAGANPPGRIDPIGPNAALGRPSEQSTTAGTQTASLADDGNLGDYAFTQSQAQPWWQVDLGTAQHLARVSVWAQGNTSQEYLTDFHVLVSDRPFDSDDLDTLLAEPDVVAVHVPGQAARATEVRLPPGTVGRYVRVQLDGTGRLNPAEIQVWNR